MKQVDNASVKHGDMFLRKGRKKRNAFFVYFYLFIFSFVIALIIISYAVKTYSPDIDVSIGDVSSDITFEDSIDFEARPIDERLKWIKSEDDMTGSESKKIKNRNEDDYIMTDSAVQTKNSIIKNKVNVEPSEKEIYIRPQKLSLEETVNLPKYNSVGKVLKDEYENDKRIEKTEKNEKTSTALQDIKSKPVNKVVEVSITKVYAGSYSTVDEAMEAQKNVAFLNPSLSPFIKNINGKYFVQAGSFYDMQKADALMLKLREQGYFPKKYTEK